MNRKIFVTFEKEGIHCYPAAGTDPKLESVAFLQYPHRHIFKFRVEIGIVHNDRDIEFILAKRWLEGLYSENILILDSHSCEQIAEELIEKIKEKYPYRDISVEVSEDGENGCRLEYETNPGRWLR